LATAKLTTVTLSRMVCS